MDIWKQLYTTMDGPHLEYGIQVWSPIIEKDISKLKKIKRRATRTQIKKYTYNQHIRSTHLRLDWIRKIIRIL